MGDINSASGFDFNGTLNVGSNQVVLQDADRAQLGVLTSISGGGILNSINGSDLGNGEVLTGTGNNLIQGEFTNNGTVNGDTGSGLIMSFDDDVDGAGAFTGNVKFLQEYNPGNSTAVVNLENVAFGSSSTLGIELGGLNLGEFDKLLVSNDAILNGGLAVSFTNGLTLDFSQEFLILDIAGARSGMFSGLGEGSLVGNYGGVNLFISYGSGDGNDIGLFTTAVPEPTSFMLFGIALVEMSRRRRLKSK